MEVDTVYSITGSIRDKFFANVFSDEQIRQAVDVFE